MKKFNEAIPSDNWATRVFIGLFLIGTGGCSMMASQVWDNEKAPAGFIDKTHVLAELHYKFTRKEVLTGDDPTLKGWPDKLYELGYGLDNIENGSVVSADSYCFGHNSVVGCKYIGFYVAYVPPNLRRVLTAKYAYAGEVRNDGDLLEIELRRTRNGDIVGIVVGIYRKHGDWQDCYTPTLQVSGVYAASSVGPPVAVWIDCDGAEEDGWTRVPVRGAPSGNSVVTELRKSPPEASP